MQIPLLTPATSWQLPTLGQLPSWTSAKRIAIDCETRDPDLKTLGPGVRRPGSFIAGVSFAIEDGPGAYLPVQHQGGGNLNPEAVFAYLRDQAEQFRGDLVGANLSYDLDWLAEYGVHFPNVRFVRDVQIAEPLIDELQMSYSLDNIAKRYGMAGKFEETLRLAARAYGIDPKKELWRLPAHYVAEYAIEDTRLPLALLRRQERIIDEQDLWQVYDLESRLLPILVKMRRRGVRVNYDKLSKIEQWSEREEREALEKVFYLTGHRIQVGDVWKPDALAPALQFIGLELGKNEDGSWNIDKELLAGVDHEVARALERARKTNKLRTTFANSIRTHSIKGRIHCTFNQLRVEKDNGDLAGAAFGRLSCVNPNMQQQPSKDEFAKMWRDIYEPDEGKLWVAADYSQQEPRVLTHYAELCNLPGAFAAAERYRTDPATDNHQMMADMAGIDRKPAKEIYLGLCYGMGGAKLCKKLGLPTRWAVVYQRCYYDLESEQGQSYLKSGLGKKQELAGEEGQNLLNRFDSNVPFVRKLAKECEATARERGYILTLLGRRCRFPKLPNGTFDWTYKALNRLIQGSSGDQTKKAMVEAEAAGIALQLQVHDEIDTSVESKEEAEALAEIMRNCVPLRVPSKVDVELGSSWGDSMS